MVAIRMIAAAALALQAGASAKVAQFNVGGVDFALPIPRGYCLPSGPGEASAQALAAGDTVNRTNLSLHRCDGKATYQEDYTLFKTPVNTIAATIDRKALLDGMGAAFNDPVVRDAISKSPEDAAKSLTTTLGKKVDMVGHIQPLGRDDVCAYMGGILFVSNGSTSYKQSAGACITSVDGKVLTINRYDRSNTTQGVANLILEAKAIALTVRRVAPRH